ncbi:MAG: thioredoxin domain-containing protein [Myxococcota bacterium]
MSKEASRLALAAGALLVVFGIGAFLYNQSQSDAQSSLLAAADDTVFERPHSVTKGSADAQVTIVEFLDPECGSCKLMHPYVKRVMNQYGSRVRLVIRYLPLHKNSIQAIAALEAAREQDRFWDMLEILFREQHIWGSHKLPRPELIPGYAEQIGLDMEAYDRVVSRGEYKKLADIDRADAATLGVRGTPTFFVNGRPLEKLGYDGLRQLVADALAQSSRTDSESGTES